jgi:hypothetical protein
MQLRCKDNQKMADEQRKSIFSFANRTLIRNFAQ